MLGHRWQLGEAAASDVVLLETSAYRGLQGAGAARPLSLYVLLDGEEPLPPGAFCGLPRPLNNARVIELLHRAEAELERRRGDLAATTILPTHLRPEMTATERSIGTSMRIAVRWVLQNSTGAATLFSAHAARILTALPGRGYATRLTSAEIANLLRANPQVRILTLTPREEKQERARRRMYGSLGKLEWIYWIAGSNGELRPELFVSKPYRLATFPDFSRLPHYRSDVKMASLLKSQALTVGQLAERAEVRLETAVNFVNACCALGYLSSDPATV
jgi:hypothetical protein